ncbi:MAG: hypothetical protein V1901_03710 [Patescibacteria group bacterium]
MIVKTPELNSLVENYSESELITSTTAKVYQDKLVLNIITNYTGQYIIKFYCETAISLVAERVFVRVIEGINVCAEVCPPVKENYTNGQWLPIVSFKKIDLTKGVLYTFRLQFKVSNGTGYIRRARFLFRRIF